MCCPNCLGRGGELVSREVMTAGNEHAILAFGVYAILVQKAIEEGKSSQINIEDFGCGDHNKAMENVFVGLKNLKIFTGVQSGDRAGGFAITATMSDGTFLVCTQGTSTAEDIEQDLRSAGLEDLDLGGKT